MIYRQWGCDVIGMTNMPEAKLAREAELCYATVAMVTDWDCWHPEHGTVTIPEIMAVFSANADRARDLVRRVAPLLATHDPLPAWLRSCARLRDPYGAGRTRSGDRRPTGCRRRSRSRIASISMTADD